MHKNCSFIRNRTSERGELTQRTNEPVRFLIQKQLVHKCSTNHLPCDMAFILYILRIRIILPEFYFKSFLFTSEKHRSLLWLARTHLCTKIFWHGFLTSISQYVFNKKTCIQCRENFLGLYIDNRETKISVYAKRQKWICTTWPSFPLFSVYSLLLLHKNKISNSILRNSQVDSDVCRMR